MGKPKKRDVEALATYYAWAESLQRAAGAADGGAGRGSSIAAATFNPEGAGIAMHWCLALAVLIQGYERLALEAPEVDDLLADQTQRDCLLRLARRVRRFRRRPLRNRDAGCLGADVERWGGELMEAFGRLLHDELPAAGAPAGAPARREADLDDAESADA
jgi:hypothetical protein